MTWTARGRQVQGITVRRHVCLCQNHPDATWTASFESFTSRHCFHTEVTKTLPTCCITQPLQPPHSKCRSSPPKKKGRPPSMTHRCRRVAAVLTFRCAVGLPLRCRCERLLGALLVVVLQPERALELLGDHGCGRAGRRGRCWWCADVGHALCARCFRRGASPSPSNPHTANAGHPPKGRGGVRG